MMTTAPELAPTRTPSDPTTTTHSHPESNSHLDAAPRMRRVEQRTRPRTRDVVKRCLIAFAGILGVIAILVTVAPFFGWTVVRLATGSMAPTFPTDSLLVTHQVSATDVRIGDVVMVQRPGELPITHRVVAMQPEGGGLERLTLKGDANKTEDATPYLVRDVGLVTTGVPWGGQVFDDLHSRVGMAALTVFAALVVLWAWWPQAPQRRAHAGAREHGSGV
jgi:signal peptidase I